MRENLGDGGDAGRDGVGGGAQARTAHDTTIATPPYDREEVMRRGAEWDREWKIWFVPAGEELKAVGLEREVPGDGRFSDRRNFRRGVDANVRLTETVTPASHDDQKITTSRVGVSEASNGDWLYAQAGNKLRDHKIKVGEKQLVWSHILIKT